MNIDALTGSLDGSLKVWVGAAITLVLFAILWVLGRLIISRIVRRAVSGKALFNRRGFRWATPVLRPFESERRTQRAKTIASLLSSLYNFVIVILCIVYLLLDFKVNVAPLLASLGILGVAVGFGCQQLIKDFLAGIFITLEDQYGIGDTIETSEVVGVVESVGLRITRVKAQDGAIWYLRNGEILQVGNRSQGNYKEVSDDHGPHVREDSASVTTGSAVNAAVPVQQENPEHKPGQKAGE